MTASSTSVKGIMSEAITYVSAIGSGLGDLILCLPLIQKLIAEKENVVLVTRSFRQLGLAERIAGIKGEIAEEKLSLKPADKYINLRAHPLQTNHVWGTPEFEEFFGGPSNMERIVQAISADFGIEFSYECLTPLSFTKHPELENTIAFVPGTDGFYKHWPHEYWMELHLSIRSMGFDIVVMGKDYESPPVARLLKEGLNHLKSPTIADAIDSISSCRAVVSVDTGLMHLAVNQGLPTFAFIHPGNYHNRSAKNCVNFISPSFCPSTCRDNKSDSPPEGFNAADKLSVDLKFDHKECCLPLSENCMAKIKVQDVFAAMKTILF